MNDRLEKETHIVYILYSSRSDIYYKGYTTDLKARLLEHNKDIGRARYTFHRGPWELVYSRKYTNKREALKEEIRIKKLNRASIERLVKNQHD